MPYQSLLSLDHLPTNYEPLNFLILTMERLDLRSEQLTDPFCASLISFLEAILQIFQTKLKDSSAGFYIDQGVVLADVFRGAAKRFTCIFKINVKRCLRSCTRSQNATEPPRLLSLPPHFDCKILLDSDG